MTERTLQAVLESHLRCRQSGDVDGDVARNCPVDAVLLTPREMLSGRDDVRRWLWRLRDQVGNARFAFPAIQVRELYALLRWHCYAGDTVVDDGVDSFVIEHGRIAFHSLCCTIGHMDRGERT